ncbi:MAG: hypothetical protein AAGA48_28250 [Myxococcota bacterium]
MDGETPAPGAPASVVRTREDGGTFPNVGDLVQESLTEFTDSIVPYILSFLGLIAGYLVVGVGMSIVWGLLTIVVVVLVSALGALVEGLGSVGVTLVGLLTVGVNLALLGLGLVGGMALVAPLTGSYFRAVAAHQRGEGELELASAFSTLSENAVQMAGMGAILGAATFVGGLFCLLPALAVPVFLGFAIPIVALHGLPVADAARLNVTHVRDHLQEHLPIALSILGLNLIGGVIPVVGPAFTTAYTVRAYRKIFGDGEAPQVGLLTDGQMDPAS